MRDKHENAPTGARCLPVAASLVALVLFCLSAKPVHAEIAGAATVIDGDTIAIGHDRIRLFGIDAPEKKQQCRTADVTWPCGERASQALVSYAAGGLLVCKGEKRDRYGRLLAVCYSGTEDLNARMVREGWALAFRRYSSVYTAEEDEARQARTGLWRGDFIAPWDWRHGIRFDPTE